MADADCSAALQWDYNLKLNKQPFINMENTENSTQQTGLNQQAPAKMVATVKFRMTVWGELFPVTAGEEAQFKRMARDRKPVDDSEQAGLIN